MTSTHALHNFPSLGEIGITEGASAALHLHDVSALSLVRRHATKDWGEVCSEDWEMNDRSDEVGGVLLSAYRLSADCVIWVFSTADRSSTTLLLPDEY